MFEKEAERSFDELDDRGVGDDHDDDKYYMDDITWWKEITPPKKAKK